MGLLTRWCGSTSPRCGAELSPDRCGAHLRGVARPRATLDCAASGYVRAMADAPQGPTVDDYLQSGHATVPGWFATEDQSLFAKIDAVQRRRDVRGDLLEIGVYQGRSAILLGYMARDDERLVVCDLFGQDATNEYSLNENAWAYPTLERGQFEENYLRWHGKLPDVISGPSSSLGGACTPRSFRFIHVDGSHMYPDVANDLLLSKELCNRPESVVAIDDIRSSHTPGVWAAAWEAVFTHGLVPLVVSPYKMYATWGDAADQFAHDLRAELEADPTISVTEQPVGSATVLVVAPVPRAAASRRGQLVMDWAPPKLRRMLGRRRASG